MKTALRILFLVLLAASPPVRAQIGTAFTFQGRLTDGSTPANGIYDLEFKLYDAETGGSQVGSTLVKNGVAVSAGLFSVSLDFGPGAFTGDRGWLGIAAKVPAAGTYTPLTPRQELTPTPNAVFATSSGTVAAGGVNTTQLADGSVTALKLGPGAVTEAAIATGQVVKSLNGLTDGITLAGAGGASVSAVGNTLTVSSAPCAVPGMLVAGVSGDTTLIGAGYTEVSVIQSPWTLTSIGAGVPSGRAGHTTVWTGTRMIVWGGNDATGVTYFNTGGQYDPVTDTWTATATTAGVPGPRSQHVAVWTGLKMVVWGGVDGLLPTTGGQYDPVANSWTATSTTGVPPGRQRATAVWTGSKMIVWGGFDGTRVNTGGQYDPASNTWTATSMATGVPSGRSFHTAVWTGTRMIVWGGFDGTAVVNTGGVYDPAGDQWTATSTGANVPVARHYHTAVWTGSRMVIWGGGIGTGTNTGGQYDPGTGPGTDSWTPTSVGAGVPAGRYLHSGVWTGTRMVVWGGNSGAIGRLSTGGYYDPATDTWTPTPAPPGQLKRAEHTAVWTGSKMIVWGGYDGPTYLNTGGQLGLGISYFVKN